MRKLISSRFNFFLLVIMAAAFIPVLAAFKINTAADAFIELQNQRLNFIPKEFYIARIDDERADRTLIGKILPMKSNAGKPDETLKVDFKGGAAAAVKGFIDNSFTADKTLRPIIIKITTFSVVESPAANTRADGRIGLTITFGFERDEEFIKLGDYSTASTYQRNTGPPQQVEPLLRNAIVNTVTYLNNWMNKQADTNIKLAKGVRINFTDHQESPEGDTIYYDINRPLRWDDFQLKPQNSKYGAEVFASLGYNESISVSQGIINLKLDIKVYLPKSACWARYEAMTNSSLVHEQHHFDIVKIVGEHFKKQILAEKLKPGNYDGPINMAYFDALREINALQKQYDTETGHSTNTYQQQLWNARIEKELQELGIKPSPGQAAGLN
ncbi:hypothetical protein IDJ77_09790 [Mucilaginibacter sp. ZT4R22]|uniref:DUF922 domain-containing protein n=1 Tax=Mucilaginibacter pankratovii TaxID=2772110 RepID=A0ABR7WRV3_9SPHI|nr:hypothetical protein [Mucilaginibacter pankratovii]MBD1364099.1 hypothetical protein [Mucilaginibacter pankratovii]